MYAIVNFDDLDAKTISANNAKLNPPPAAIPSTTMMTGTLQLWKRCIPWCRTAVNSISVPSIFSISVEKNFRSPPKLYIEPAAPITMHLTLESVVDFMATSINSWANFLFIEFPASGLLNSILATPSFTAYLIVS